MTLALSLADVRAERDAWLGALAKYLENYMRSPEFLGHLRNGLMLTVLVKRLRNLSTHAAMGRIVS